MNHRSPARLALTSLLLAACGTPAGLDQPEAAPPGVPPPGWTLSDETPYARVGHTAILDEGADRMIVVSGGPANDTWALPLSGARANRWIKLVPDGEYPPPRGLEANFFPNAGIYDPFGKRMLVLVAGSSVLPLEQRVPELWELALEGPPRWRRIQTAGSAPGSELGVGKLVLDRTGKRAVAIGGDFRASAVWTFALEGEPRWTRLDGAPPPAPVFTDGAVATLDAKRNRVILLDGLTRDVWAVSLATGGGSRHGEEGPIAGLGSVAVTDEAHDRVVLIGDSMSGLSTFSLATHESSTVPMPSSQHQGASAVVDGKRQRVILFSGHRDRALTDGTWTVSLDTLELSELVPAQHGAAFPMQGLNTVWDPTRGLVVSFGSPTAGADDPSTWGHGLADGAAWQRLPVPEPAPPSRAAAIYDPVGQAIVSFGGYRFREQKDVLRLSSAPGASWEKLNIEDGPAERSRHVGVYDDARRRLVTFGGWRDSSYPPAEILTDTWALSLDGAGRWTRLPTTGAPPTTPIGAVGVYDSPRDRMVVYGGRDGRLSATGTTLYVLSLGETPTWTELAWTGAAPEALEEATAIYEAARERMILVDLPASGAVVYALELSEPRPTWHRFCAPGLRPAGTEGTSNAVLIPDGLFVSASGGAFRFDLDTPYCD